jgi:hypothetical protein
MKWLILIPVFFLFTYGGCKKEVEKNKIRGKLVHQSCASAVVQILDSAFFKLGQAQWQQSPGKPTYEHVFAVGNLCSFPGGITEGSEFTFEIMSKDPSNDNCAVCMLWDNPPSTTQLIKVHKK